MTTDDRASRGARRALAAWAWIVAGSAIAGWAVHRLWPLVAPADDPFRSTYALLPLVLASLVWIGRLAGVRPAGWTSRALVAVLLVAVPLRHALGWSVDDGPWAAALAVALAATVARRVLALRACLGQGDGNDPTPAPGAVFFALPLVVYLAVQPWALANRPADGDEPYYLLVAHSLAYDLDTDLDDQYANQDSLRFVDRALEPQLGDPTDRDGSLRSRHNALLPLLLAPGYRLAARAGAAATMAVLAAALSWLFLRTALRWHTARGGVFLAWVALSFLPPLLVYAHQIWVEIPAALLTLLALDRLWALHSGTAADPADARSRRRDLVIFCAAVALLPILKLRLALVAALLVLLAAWRLPSRRRWVLGLPVAAFGLLLASYAWRFGNPFKLYTSEELDLLDRSPWTYVQGLVGIFYDAAFGLFAVAPLWALLIPAVAMLVLRRGAPDARRADVLWVVVPYLLAVAPRLEWYGGWSPPFRYPMVLLPLLALLLVPLFAQRHRAGVRLQTVLLGVPTLLLTLLWVTVPAWTYNLADGGSFLLHQAGVQTASDVVRLFPSSVRPRAATWVWVVASLALVPLAAWRGRPGRRGAARRAAGPLALATLCAGAVAVPIAAAKVPTGHVEIEDLWVQKDDGVLHPSTWTRRRPAGASGWLLGPRTAMTIPAVPGGDTVTIDIRVIRFGRGASNLWAEIHAPGAEPRVVGRWRMREPGVWNDFVVTSEPWPAGARLVLRNAGRHPDPDLGVVIDWVDFRWSDGD